MIKTIKKYLSGNLKHIVLTGVLGLSVHFSYADDITNTNNYLPNGKYRLFGSGRGEVQNINNNIRLHGQLTQQAGNLQIETKNYQGNLSYEQHFHNHGHREHSPFSNTAQKNFSAKKGSVVQGGATLTDLSVTGYEIHPADAYDGEQGGGYPAPTGARDEYLYEVNGKEVSVKVVALDKLPNKINDNQLLREAGIDPAKYEQPQTTDNRTQIERVSFADVVTTSNSGGFYSNLGDFAYNANDWHNAQVRLPETLHSPNSNENRRVIDTYAIPKPTIVIPSASARFSTDGFGNILTHSNLRTVPSGRVYLYPNDMDIDLKNVVVAINKPLPIIRGPSPYGYSKNSPFGGSLLGGGSSNNKGSFSGGSNSGNGGNDNQNDNDEPLIFGYYDDGDDYAHSDDDNYGYDDDNYYGSNHQNQQQPDTAENQSSFEEDLWELRLSPPPPITEYDDGTKNDTNTANNYPTQNNDDWQPEKWDSPLDLNVAEFAIGLGSIVNDALNIANKRGTQNSVDNTLQNALTCRKPECAYHIDNAKLEGSLTEAQANALKKAALNNKRILNNGEVKIGGYKKISLDVETGGSGKINIHLQVDGQKYFYNNTTGTYVSENGAKLPNSIAKNSKIQQATDKALQYAQKIQD